MSVKVIGAGQKPIRDATATPPRVFKGDIFYNNEGKQVGTLEIPTDFSSLKYFDVNIGNTIAITTKYYDKRDNLDFGKKTVVRTRYDTTYDFSAGIKLNLSDKLTQNSILVGITYNGMFLMNALNRNDLRGTLISLYNNGQYINDFLIDSANQLYAGSDNNTINIRIWYT